MYGMYDFSMGIHWKVVMKIAVIYQTAINAPITYTLALMKGVGKMRRYMVRMVAFNVNRRVK